MLISYIGSEEPDNALFVVGKLTGFYDGKTIKNEGKKKKEKEDYLFTFS